MASPPPRTTAVSDSAASIAILEIANLLSVPMALTAVIRLGVPAAILRSGENTPLSASEILPSSSDPSLLHLLSSYNIFQEHISDCGARRYSLTSLGQTLVGEASYADYVLQHHQDALVHVWPKLHEAQGRSHINPGVQMLPSGKLKTNRIKSNKSTKLHSEKFLCYPLESGL
jgi:hypothetical protein